MLHFFSEERRLVLGDKLIDLANLAAGALVFGQGLTSEPVSAFLLAAGSFVWLVLLLSGLWILPGGKRGR